MDESRSFTLTSTILKFDVVYDVAMTSTPKLLTTELRGLMYNQCIIDNTCLYAFLIRIRVCNIRFVSTEENRGKPCLVCKNIRIFHGWELRIEISVRGSLFGNTRLCRVMLNGDTEGWVFLSHKTPMIDFFLHTYGSPAFDFNEEVVINE